MGHLLSVRTRLPYFHGLSTARTWEEVWAVLRGGVGIRWPVIFGWCVSVITINIFNEVPALQLVCGTSHLPAVYWGYAIGWSAAIFGLAEVRKWLLFLYPDNIFSKIVSW